jgi:CheY-like chemotaxis protein
MVYGFVKQSGGHVKIYSEVGQGTTVRLYLPRAMQQEDVETETETGATTGGSETVLVVEDDEDVRDTVVAMLSELGYQVLKAKNADSALAIVESGVPIDLLFTDVIMPGKLRSPELARKARERIPGIRVLFTSGYTENAIVHGGRLDEGIDLLSKPYTRETLARRLRHALRNGEQIAAARASTVKAPPANKSLRILLVEDEMLIRMSTAEMLAEMGHTVFEAGDAEEALSLLDGKGADLLLTDLGLPRISGAELARAARKRFPNMPVIFASGYGGTNGGDDRAIADAVILPKPFDGRQLIAALAKATNSQS